MGHLEAYGSAVPPFSIEPRFRLSVPGKTEPQNFSGSPRTTRPRPILSWTCCSPLHPTPQKCRFSLWLVPHSVCSNNPTKNATRLSRSPGEGGRDNLSNYRTRKLSILALLFTHSLAHPTQQQPRQGKSVPSDSCRVSPAPS